MNAQAELFSVDRFEAFMKFHTENPQVFRIFQERALEMIKTGRKHYSARTILEVARWDIHLQTNGEPFKINNNHIPFYANLFREIHPQHGEFFRARVAQ